MPSSLTLCPSDVSPSFFEDFEHFLVHDIPGFSLLQKGVTNIEKEKVKMSH